MGIDVAIFGFCAIAFLAAFGTSSLVERLRRRRTVPVPLRAVEIAVCDPPAGLAFERVPVVDGDVPASLALKKLLQSGSGIVAVSHGGCLTGFISAGSAATAIERWLWNGDGCGVAAP